ncbi:MAG: hypothetical protein HRT88_18435, partial [Lentisphaeraceae bacterium]|nr:hypothetical protein [Lentisphaeraceae bacterium]
SKLYFTGETLHYSLVVQPSYCDKVLISTPGNKLQISANQFHQRHSLKLELADKTANFLKLSFIKGDKIISIKENNFTVLSFPENISSWIKENRFTKHIDIDDIAFFESESSLFPEKFKENWLQRQLISDSDTLDFGPIRAIRRRKTLSLCEAFPNSLPVLEKFSQRLAIALKLKTRHHPVTYSYEIKHSDEELWQSAAFTFQYLLHLESTGNTVDWHLPTLNEYHLKYTKEKDAQRYIHQRKQTVKTFINNLMQEIAPGSKFLESSK